MGTKVTLPNEGREYTLKLSHSVHHCTIFSMKSKVRGVMWFPTENNKN